VPEALAAATAALVRVSAAVARRDTATLEGALRAARGVAPEAAIDEALLQSHLFVGFPVTLEAMRLRAGLRSGPPVPEVGDADFRARGERVCATVYGPGYPRLRQAVAALHPDLDRWMVEEGYGRVLGRPGLDLATRELCIAALLAVWDAPRQLHSHLRGARNAGATDAEIGAALEIAREMLPAGRAAEVEALWAAVRSAGD
jgi:4-carboxymuconolactone decarboxylase